MKCSQKQQPCFKCVAEDKEQERRIKRNLKLESDRLARQAAYARELQEIQDKVEDQRLLIQYQTEKEDQKKNLEQHRADLAALKETAARIQEQKQRESVKAAQPDLNQEAPCNSDGPKSPKNNQDVLSGAQEEWEHLKRVELASNKHLDELMSMIGLEDVKQEFLSINPRWIRL